VTIVMGKIVYGNSVPELSSYVANVENKTSHSNTTTTAIGSNEWSALKIALTPQMVQFPGQQPVLQQAPTPANCVNLSSAQFLRFKNAGKQNASVAKSFTDPLTGNVITYQRTDRASDATLEKWDVARYNELVGRVAPWGTHGATNRDHLLANSINQLMYQQGANPYSVHSPNDLKNQAFAMTVSGKHHREGSATYGGRVQAIKQQHANNPTVGAHVEMDAMMAHKNDPSNRTSNKATLRIEMVGAYAYLYKCLVEQGVIVATDNTDKLLINYLRAAAAADDGQWRINPANIGLIAQSSTTTGSGTKWTV